MKSTMRWNRRTAMFVIGASMLALCVAARRLGIGMGADGPSLWLALLFLSGAALILIVFIGRLASIVRKR
ncbi:hypothetical protein ACX80J_13425 [Arthrobacter sp. MDB2-24]